MSFILVMIVVVGGTYPAMTTTGPFTSLEDCRREGDSWMREVEKAPRGGNTLRPYAHCTKVTR